MVLSGNLKEFLFVYVNVVENQKYLLIGITFPTHLLCFQDKDVSKKLISVIINDLDTILNKFDKDIPIYDINTELNLKDEVEKELVLKELL